MKKILLRRRHLCAGLPALLLAGCSGAVPTHYYRLAVIPGTPRTGPPQKIIIRSIAIPGYLQQNGIAQPASGGYQVQNFTNDLWAESLANMLQSVLVQDLAQRLPSATILPSGGAIATPAGSLVEINILRFDPGPGGDLLLLAQLAIKPAIGAPALQTQNFSRTMPLSGSDPTNIVAAMSTLWGACADQLAGMLG